MDEQTMWEWFSTTPQGFAAGVIVLIFGSNAILSKESMISRFSGIGWLVGKVEGRIKRRREQAAKDAVKKDAERELTISRQHEYIVDVNNWGRESEIAASEDGWVVRPRRFPFWRVWLRENYPDE